MPKLTILIPLVWAAVAQGATREPVDASVVLAVDVSASITDSTDGDGRNEYMLQLNGIGKALRDPELAYVLEKCSDFGVGLTYVEWAGGSDGGEYVDQRIPWRKIQKKQDLDQFARTVELLGQRNVNGETDILTALRASARLIDLSPFEGLRKIISLSSDGFQNVLGPAKMAEGTFDLRLLRARDDLVGAGFVIDSLVVMSDNYARREVGDLEQYHRTFVKGGPGSVVTAVADFEEYGRGLKANLLRELDNCSF